MSWKAKWTIAVAIAATLNLATAAGVYFSLAWPRLAPGTEVITVGGDPANDDHIPMGIYSVKGEFAYSTSYTRPGRAAVVIYDGFGSLWDGERSVRFRRTDAEPGRWIVHRKNLAVVH